MQQIGGSFTPKPKSDSSECGSQTVRKCGALSIKWFPKKTEHAQIIQFLINLGLPENHKDVLIKDNGQVIINNLDSTICDKLCDSVTGSKLNGKRSIYCQGIVLTTPQKSTTDGGDKCQSPSQTETLDKGDRSQSHLLSDTQGKNDSTVTINDKLNGFVFADLNDSKFFSKPQDSESDSFNNDDIWLKNNGRRKRKQKVMNKTEIKKLDRKRTPKSK